MTGFFAMGGALADIIGQTMPAFFGGGPGFPMLWGLWIPLCYATIPTIHQLCRQVDQMEERLSALESRLAAGVDSTPL